MIELETRKLGGGDNAPPPQYCSDFNCKFGANFGTKRLFLEITFDSVPVSVIDLG